YGLPAQRQLLLRRLAADIGRNRLAHLRRKRRRALRKDLALIVLDIGVSDAFEERRLGDDAVELQRVPRDDVTGGRVAHDRGDGKRPLIHLRPQRADGQVINDADDQEGEDDDYASERPDDLHRQADAPRFRLERQRHAAGLDRNRRLTHFSSESDSWDMSCWKRRLSESSKISQLVDSTSSPSRDLGKASNSSPRAVTWSRSTSGAIGPIASVSEAIIELRNSGDRTFARLSACLTAGAGSGSASTWNDEIGSAAGAASRW